jgi:hypothetical protein
MYLFLSPLFYSVVPLSNYVLVRTISSGKQRQSEIGSRGGNGVGFVV